ncbi:ATPase, T2SS/T4P/T4SS family [Paraburkholderia sp. SIMBA_009]|uniref:Type II secretory ATPase GspE/PulE/Tfp pilus assembly ATPase PilB-like protein n=1 Tax=Paraburkholderia tropica TaxID=92647 RepID=A0ABX5MC82_9BURK|nr:ATPase, T2SS/T4P/T4SS family [Paraburkholderia tropica]PXX05649.1 type II secretory ATPase GspE/PulE/Tfp pilus assembly ATPase PilB-like protein [Paraburkholderia tropica]PZW70771.1 type II secretory ATPase GspE/PulE/Tfp pilus assembly ATPase PilB-like protein [Paraburkholderia tropica]
MSLFGNMESSEKPRSGMMARLRAWRGGFVEESEAAASLDPVEPVLGATRPVHAAHAARKGTGAPAGSLGAYLRDADVTDVDAFETADGWSGTKTPNDVAGDDGADAGVHPGVPSAASLDDEALSFAMPESMASGSPVEAPSAEARAEARDEVREVVRDEVREQVGDDPRAAADSAPRSEKLDEGNSGDHDEPRGHNLQTPDEDKGEAQQRALAVSDIEYTPVGMPRLNSAQALADFKRVLCDTTPDATLRITPEARREFVAVDMQAGMAVVIATREFHETALYATYLQDLERVHITVREEMVATADVIDGVYERARIRLSKHVPEGSRAIALFLDVIDAANTYGASDVHWESRDYLSDAEVRFRVDGDLYTYERMPKATILRALSAVYQDLVQSNTNSGNAFQPSAAQSAMIPIALATATLNLRWQSAPQMGGFDVALRMLDGNFRNYSVRMPEKMGIEASQLAIVEALGHVSGGAVLLSGETGSAKTTLLRALSFMVEDRELKKQYAVSMPSEYPLPWLSDQSVPRGLDETEEEFRRKVATIIRTLMRMDPDDLTIAEILDSTIAGLVVELALTGHPVRSTIHADSIIGVFMRLMGDRLRLAADEVASDKFINAVGNQKLIPLLCPHCRKPAADVMSADALETLRVKFGLDTSKMACRNDDGCEHCRKKGLLTRDGKVAAGTKGQTLAMELYRPTPEFLDRIVVRDWRGAERVWRKERTADFGSADMTGKTIYEHALYKASQGLIDPRFIDRGMKPFSVYSVMPDRDGRTPS